MLEEEWCYFSEYDSLFNDTNSTDTREKDLLKCFDGLTHD